MISFTKKLNYEKIIFLIIFIFVVFKYIQLIFQINCNYFPVWSDEFFYFVNIQSFIENNTLNASLTFSGSGSTIFGADAHGIGYPILHGVIGKIFGWGNLNFIIFNIFIVIATIVVLIKQSFLKFNEKIFASSILLLFPFIPLYSFTYMQEVIHVFIAVVLSVLIYNIYKSENNVFYIIIFITIVLLSGFLRGLWMFWLIGLLPLSKNYKQFLIYSLVFLLGAVVSFIITSLFLENTPNYFSSVLILLKQGEYLKSIESLFNHFINNIQLYFFSKEGGIVYIAMKYIVFLSTVYFLVLYLISKTRLHFSLFLIGFLNFFLLFFLYDACSWREIRSMSPIFYFYILFISFELKSVYKYFILIGFLILFILNFKMSKTWIFERNQSLNNKNVNEQNYYNEIINNVDNDKIVLVDFIPRDYSWDLLYLPLKNKNGSQIKYIIQYYNVNKVKYDYILTKQNNLDTISEKLIKNEFFTLLKYSK